MKECIANGCPALMKRPARLIASLASSLGLTLCSRDVKQAHLQSDAPFLRDMRARLPKRHGDPRADCFPKILKPLCGITEPGDCWLDTCLKFFIDDVEIITFLLGPCLLRRKNKEIQVEGSVGVVVDDAVGAGAEKFISDESVKSKKFAMTPVEKEGFDFSGAHFKQEANLACADQTSCMSSAPALISTHADQKAFTSTRGKTQWRAPSTRPDC